jgi:hypothetical protein
MDLDPSLWAYTQGLVIDFKKTEALVGLAAYLKISIGSLLLFLIESVITKRAQPWVLF